MFSITPIDKSKIFFDKLHMQNFLMCKNCFTIYGGSLPVAAIKFKKNY